MSININGKINTLGNSYWSAVGAPTPAPVANFTANTTSGVSPLTVNFTDTSTNTPTSWAWDFTNDGSTDSTVKNPSYTYSSAGTYSVKLTATNASGSGTITKVNYISVTSPAPVPPNGNSATYIASNIKGNMNSVAYGDGKYVMGGGYGTVFFSNDGQTWTESTQSLKDSGWFQNASFPSALDSINTVVWNGSEFVMLGAYGKIAKSGDGQNWSYSTGLRDSGNTWATGAPISDLHWNGSQFVAVSTFNRIAKSNDAENWTNISSTSTNFNVLSIAYNGSRYVIAGAGSNVRYSDNDGATWVFTSVGGSVGDIVSGIWTGSKFVFGTSNGHILESTNGSTWTIRTNLRDSSFGTASVSALLWDSTKYVAVGTNGKFATSTNLTSWSNKTTLSSTPWGPVNGLCIAYNGSDRYAIGGYVAVNDGVIISMP